jgi:hypothetical protein
MSVHAWNQFSGDTKLVYIVDCMKALIKKRKGITVSTPFSSKELNIVLKSIYMLDDYAGKKAFWNGGVYNMIKKAIKNFIKSVMNPKFTNKLLEDLCKNVTFHGVK